MPRALVWSILAVIGLGVYFLGVEPALGVIESNNAAAASASSRLDKLKQQLAARESDLGTLSTGEKRHGPIGPILSASQAAANANKVIEDVVLELDSVESPIVGRGELGMDDSALEQAFVGSSEELVRLIFAFNFTATPEDVVEALRRFESSPHIHSVSAVRLRLGAQDERRLSAQFTLEIWAKQGVGDRR